jgi:hypothetical protein
MNMGESFQYFDWFQVFFGNDPDSSWDSCTFNEFVLGGVEVRIFDNEIKAFERILICLSALEFCISLPFICEKSVS